jgi:hypothetical protein
MMKKAGGYVLGMVGMVVLSAGVVLGQELGDPAKLTTLKKCSMCHKAASKGDQFGVWQTKAHAKAYENLASPEAKEVAAALGIENPQQSGKCLKCHSTAYYFAETRQSEAVTLEEGVSCQSCHGPGDDYDSKAIMEDLAASIAAGMVHPAKEKRCTLCHNDQNPTWDPERYTTKDGKKVDFDVDQAYEKIKHERPAAAE